MILAKRDLSIIAFTVSAVLIPGAALTSANSIPSRNDPPAIRKGQSIPAPILEKRASKQETKALSELLFQDFESGAVNWGATGSWQIGAPISGRAGGFSSPNAAATNLSGNYPDNANDVLLSPSISIPTQGNVVVSFDEWFQLESCCDAGFVEASQDGGATWTVLGTRSGSSDWRSSSLNYTSTAAAHIQLRFRLTSDGSSTFPGWYIDNVRIALEEQDPIDVSLKTLNAQNFPFIYSTLGINDTVGACPQPLGKANFQVFEDEVVQTDFFQVLPPGDAGFTLADIVFIFDNSGSMCDDQAEVEQHIREFVDGLVDEGGDVALGLTRYGQSANSGAPIIENAGSLTTNVSDFKDNILTRNICSGANEPGYWAIVKTASDFAFRPGSARFFIEITDETPNQGGATIEDAADALSSVGATLFAVTLPSLFVHFEPLVTDVSEQLFPIDDDFQPILNYISDVVAENYRISYRTFNDVFDGVERTVRIEAVCGTQGGADTGTYTPGSVPMIQRTQETIDLGATPQVSGFPLSITVNVHDRVEPFTQDVRLYYKKTIDIGFANAAMTRVTGDGASGTWTANLPAAAVADPGVDYFIQATDGALTSSDPRNNPASDPYQIAVLPNVAPDVTHTPVASSNAGTTVPIEATAEDSTLSVAEVNLYYRSFGDLTYIKQAMTPTSPPFYTGGISETAMTAFGAEYYVEAIDNFGVKATAGSADQPYFIEANNWPKAYGAMFEDATTLELLRNYRDHVLMSSDQGRLYTTLLYSQSEEALQVLLDNPRLLDMASSLILSNQDAVAAALQGKPAQIGETQAIVTFLNDFAAKSPSALRALVKGVATQMILQQRRGGEFFGFRLH